MKTAAVICYARFLDLAAFDDTLQACGYPIRYYDAGYDAFTFDLVDTDLVIVLGGPMGAYELEDYPFIAEESAILRARVAADRPTLAICLGAQILAQALGARVYTGPKEIGWAPVTLTEAGERSVLCDIGRDAIPVLHWHGDRFDLPDGAARLASTPECANQAFSLGTTLALQFHPRSGRAALRALADLQHGSDRAHEDPHCAQPARSGNAIRGRGCHQWPEVVGQLVGAGGGPRIAARGESRGDTRTGLPNSTVERPRFAAAEAR